MAWVQNPAAVNSSGSGTAAVTFSGSTPAGNLIVVCIAQDNSAAVLRAITNVRDNIDTGVDYSVAVANVQNAGGNKRLDIYYKVATGAGTRTVTVTFTGGSPDCAVAAVEYDSSNTTLSVTNSNSANTGTSVTPGSVTPSGTATYFVGMSDANGGTITPTAGWDQRAEIESNGTCSIAVQDLVTTGAQNPTITLGTTGPWVAAIVTFEAAAPTINTQPASQTCYEGQTATFTISATPSGGSNSYQWKDDGSNVGTGSNSYTTGIATYADNGSQITCVVTDSNGSTTSSAANWTVLQAAKLTYWKA